MQRDKAVVLGFSTGVQFLKFLLENYFIMAIEQDATQVSSAESVTMP